MPSYDIEFKCKINIDDIERELFDDPNLIVSNILEEAGYPDAYIDIIDVVKRG